MGVLLSVCVSLVFFIVGFTVIVDRTHCPIGQSTRIGINSRGSNRKNVDKASCRLNLLLASLG